MKITARKLERADACEGDIKRFKKQWPDGCRITRENCRIAFGEDGLGLNVEWAARFLLSERAYDDVFNAGPKACRECEHSGSCSFPPYCEFDKARIEAFYQAARG